MAAVPQENAVHDPQVLRAIAHPVRNRILGELDAQGSLRAADIARELGIPANQASFHLRQLAKYGLVEEDPAAARDKRDRVWRATGDGAMDVNLKQLRKSPGGKAAADVFMRSSAAWGHVVVDHAFAQADEERGHVSVTQHALRLDQEDARELTAELSEVLARWTERSRAGGADRRTYLYYAAVLPHPDLPGAGGE